MFNRLISLISLVAIVIILAMMNLTTPTEVGPLGVLVFFVMVYLVVLGVVNLLVMFFRRMMGYKERTRKENYFAAMIAFGPVMLLLIQSFGVLNIATVAMATLFVILGCFVISKRL